MEIVNLDERCPSAPMIFFVAIASFDALEEQLKMKQSHELFWMNV